MEKLTHVSKKAKIKLHTSNTLNEQWVSESTLKYPKSRWRRRNLLHPSHNFV